MNKSLANKKSLSRPTIGTIFYLALEISLVTSRACSIVSHHCPFVGPLVFSVRPSAAQFMGFPRPICGLSCVGFPLPILWVSCCLKRSSLQNLKASINFIVALKACQQLCEVLASWTNLYLGVKGLIVLSNERYYVVGSLQSGELPYHLNNTLSWLQ